MKMHPISAHLKDNGTDMLRCKYIICAMIAFALMSGCAAQKKPKTAMAVEDITLQATVLFDFNKATLREDAKPILDDVAQKLKTNPAIHVLVEGHTDTVGSDTYNDILAEKRARAVGAYLSQDGVQYHRITMLSKGKREPKALGHTQEANRVNRRTEITNH